MVVPPERLAAAVGTTATMRTDNQPDGDSDHQPYGSAGDYHRVS